jgi:hypothetical protein
MSRKTDRVLAWIRKTLENIDSVTYTDREGTQWSVIESSGLFESVDTGLFCLSNFIIMPRPVFVHTEDLTGASSNAVDASTGPGSGGLSVTPEMHKILNQPDQYLSTKRGGQKLRELYVQRRSNISFNYADETIQSVDSLAFDAEKLSDFALLCYIGDLTEARRV